MGFAYLLRRRLRKPPREDFPLFCELRKDFGERLHVGSGGNAVHVVQVEPVGLQAAQRALQRRPYAPAAQFALGNFLPGQKRGVDFARKRNLVPYRFERLAHELLVGVGGIDFGGVVERAPQIERLSHQPYGFALGRSRPVAVGKTHAAHSYGGNFNVAQFSRLHILPRF